MKGNPEQLARQERFLEAVFDEADGDLVKAAEIAGYPHAKKSIYQIVRQLKTELAEQAQLYLAMHGLKAARATVDVMDNPTELGNQNKLAAAQTILDRIGVVKKEDVSVNVKAEGGIFILPPKNSEDDGAET